MPWTVTWTKPVVSSFFTSKNSSPRKQKITKMTAHTIAQVGITVVVWDISEKVHVTELTGWVPLGVTTQDFDTPIWPIDTSVGSVAGRAAVGAHDRNIYVWRADGSPLPGWPVTLLDPAKVASIDPVTRRATFVPGSGKRRGAKVVVAPAVGDVNGDGQPEVAAVVNEQYAEAPNMPSAFAPGSPEGNGRAYVIRATGMNSPGVPPGAILDPDVFLPGWPVKVPFFKLDLQPSIMTGPNGQPALADIDGDGALEVGVQGATGVPVIFGADGRSIYGRDIDGKDIPLAPGPIGASSASLEPGVLSFVGGQIFSEMNGDGVPDFAAAGIGAYKGIDLISPGRQSPTSFLVGAWDVTAPSDGTVGGALLPGLPHPVNGFQFFAQPVSTDLDGNGSRDLVIGSASYDIRAVSADGTIPAGWPKFTGGWNGIVAVGDWFGDGSQVVTAPTREGWFYVWRSQGSACRSDWPRPGHDPANTGNFTSDATPPRVITDVAATPTESGTRISWVAPGDDGPCGAAAAYEIRYSDAQIDASNWLAATPYTGPVPAPLSSGATEVLDMPRSLEGKWIALRAVDDAGNRTRVSPSVRLSALPLVTISGTFAGGMWGSISVYSKSGGTLVAYKCCIADPGGAWSIEVPVSSCGSGGGYKLIFLPPSKVIQTRWYNLADNFTVADCVSAPSSGNDMTIPGASSISGYVKDASTAADIDGAVIHGFKTDGTYTGYVATGGSGAGRFEFNLSPGENYKLLVDPGAGYVSRWHSGAPNFTSATPTAAPGTANFSVTPASDISGYVKDASSAADINGALLYFYATTTGAFSGWASSGTVGAGRYVFRASPDAAYKILAVGPASNEDLWFDGAFGYGDATPVAAPGTANFSLRTAGTISGNVTRSGLPLAGAYISAYTTCGCKAPRNVLTDASGNYAIKVVTTAASGWQYRVRVIPPAGQTRWYSNSATFPDATNVTAPASGIDQEIPP